MLPRTGFRDDAGFAHAHGQQNLTHHIIDFMRAGMVELIPLQIDLGATQMLGEPLGKIKRAGATDIMGQIAAHLFLKRRIDLGLVIGLFQRQDERHQGFRHKAPAENTKVTGLVRTVAERIGRRCVHFKILLQTGPLNGSSPNRRHKAANKGLIFLTGRRFNARGHVYSPSPCHRKRFGDIPGIQTAR